MDESVKQYEKKTRQIVMERDGYRCILCKSGSVQIHEIVPRSRFGKLQFEVLFHPKNRVCLCQNCHAEAHNINTRILMLHYLKEKYGYSYEEQEFNRYTNKND